MKEETISVTREYTRDGWNFSVKEKYADKYYPTDGEFYSDPVYTITNENMGDYVIFTEDTTGSSDSHSATLHFHTYSICPQVIVDYGTDAEQSFISNDVVLRSNGSMESESLKEGICVIADKIRLNQSFGKAVAYNLSMRLAEAEKKHPVFAEGIYQALGRIGEEYGELVQAVNHNEGEDRIMSEAYDTLAVLVRFIRGDWKQKEEDKC